MKYFMVIALDHLKYNLKGEFKFLNDMFNLLNADDHNILVI